jgi:hypothetical protein
MEVFGVVVDEVDEVEGKASDEDVDDSADGVADGVVDGVVDGATDEDENGFVSSDSPDGCERAESDGGSNGDGTDGSVPDADSEANSEATDEGRDDENSAGTDESDCGGSVVPRAASSAIFWKDGSTAFHPSSRSSSVGFSRSSG